MQGVLENNFMEIGVGKKWQSAEFQISGSDPFLFKNCHVGCQE